MEEYWGYGYSLWERITTLQRTELRQAATKQGLKLVQLEALHYFSMCNRYSNTPGALTEFLSLTKGTVSQTIRALEQKGFIEKQVSKEDRRVVHCVLTEEGRDVVEEAYPPQLFEAAWDELRKQEGAKMVELFSSFLRNLQRHHGNRSFGQCQTCRHFRREEEGFRCGLTGEPLQASDSLKICREHEFV